MISKHQIDSVGIFPMAVVLGKGDKAHRVIQIVSHAFDSIRLIESQGESATPLTFNSPQLAVVTDSFAAGVSLKLLNHIKKGLNPSRLICLAENISAETEIELRSTGLIFLGAYRDFLYRADSIVRFFTSGVHPWPQEGRTGNGYLLKHTKRNGA